MGKGWNRLPMSQDHYLSPEFQAAIEAFSADIQEKCVRCKVMGKDNQLLATGAAFLDPPVGAFYPDTFPIPPDGPLHTPAQLEMEDGQKLDPIRWHLCPASGRHFHFEVQQG